MGGNARETGTPLTAECDDACREHFQVGDRKLGWTGYKSGVTRKKKKREMRRKRTSVGQAMTPEKIIAGSRE